VPEMISRRMTYSEIFYLFSTADKNSWKFLNGDPGPQIPSLTMYAMCLGSDAPVAEA